MEKSKKRPKKNKNRNLKILGCVMTAVLLISCVLAIPCSASTDTPVEYQEILTTPILEVTQNFFISDNETDIYKSVSMPVLNKFNRLDTNYNTTIDLEGRVNYNNFLIRPSLYNGQILANALINYDPSQDANAWGHSIDLNCSAYSDNSSATYHYSSLRLVYDPDTNDGGRIMLIGIDDTDGDGAINSNTDFYYLFSMPVSGYVYNNVVDGAIQGDYAYIGSNGELVYYNINSKVYFDNPVFSSKAILAYGTSNAYVQNPLYQWFIQTDGHWEANARDTITCVVDTELDAYTQKISIPSSYVAGSGEHTIKIKLGQQAFDNEKSRDRNQNIFLKCRAGNFAEIVEATATYHLRMPVVNEYGEIGYYKRTVNIPINNEYIELIHWFTMDDYHLMADEYGTPSSSVFIDDAEITIRVKEHSKTGQNVYEGVVEVYIAQSVGLENIEIVQLLEDQNTSRPPILVTMDTIIQFVKNTINAMLAIEFIPIMSIGTIVTFIVGIVLFVWILKLFMGG